MNLTNYGDPRVSADDWVSALPELHHYARVSTEDLRAPEGRGMTEAHWMTIARRLQEIAEDDSIDGVVFSHGTNTMSETAYFLNLVVSIEKPVVFVGAQRPWTGISGDGPLNMVNAVRVAATPEAAGLGILHATNQNIHPARDVHKSSAYRVNTFQSIDLGAIGVADPDIVRIYTAPARLHTHKSIFNIGSIPEELPAVEVLYGYTGTPGYLVDTLVEHGVKGIIIDGTGAGSIPRDMHEAIERAQENGIVVVATARTRAGRVQDTERRREAKIVPGDNLPPEKARILLQLALTQTTSVDRISEFFVQY